MAGWLAGFGSKIGSLFGSQPASAHVGAFGKHPGWNDHLDDLGLETEPLVAAKQYLYVQGVGGVIDAGQWEALPEGEALAEFRHWFVWSDERDVLAGKMWSSSDGKGRTKYPMVVCAHFANRPEPGLPDVAPLLDQLEQSCRATTSADDVRRLIFEARNAAAMLLHAPQPADPAPAAFAQDIWIDPASEEAARIAYATLADLGNIAATGVGRVRINLKLGQFKGAPRHIRVPADPARPFVSQRFWQRFFANEIPRSAPQLYIMPAGSPWLDVIVGLPTAKHLFCLRAGNKALPLASAIPFNLTEAARMGATARWRKVLEAT